MPPAAPLNLSHDPWIVALSVLIASFASFVALDLAQRVRTPDRPMALMWWLGGSLAMGSGIWSMHFVAMLALRLPFPVGYAYGATALSWVAAVAASAVALHVASYPRLTAARLAGGATAMAAGICTMHYTGMAALDLAPGIHWHAGRVVASVMVALLASTAALLVFFGLRRLQGRAAWRAQAAAALLMGAAIAGMHHVGMAAAGIDEGTVCLSADALRGDHLGVLISVSTLALLSLTLLTSALDAHLRRQAAGLSASLQTATTELQARALSDALTGLPNRPAFDLRVGLAAQRCGDGGRQLAVLFVDLDGFKAVNDSFGHATGDALLQEMARRVAAQVRRTDTVARVGGDQFVVLLEDLRPTQDTHVAVTTAQRILDACGAPVDALGPRLQLSCSVGIVTYPPACPPAELLSRADAAVGAAKRAGGATYAFYEPHMSAGMREQIELLRDLRQALDEGRLELHYQPQIDTATGGVLGVEALARWRHPVRGMVGPAQFIAVAERFGLIGTLGDWVIAEACRQARQWRDDGLDLPVAVNLSVHQLRQDDLVQRIRQSLLAHGLAPAQLICEITESAAMEDGEASLLAFRRLAELGVALSIDDFGTGYSSLAYLRRLRASQLKIDRSFVQDLESSADARAIVEAVVRLAHSLGLTVVAEGVETPAQREALAALHCDELQGYLIARPMPPADLARWAAAHTTRPRLAEPA